MQNKLIALHHLDAPWRPSDIEQREGRIIRQNNENETVFIFRYVTEGTFDGYSWQVIENKQKMIGQVVTGKSPVRCCEDIDAVALNYAEVKALCVNNPYIKEKMDLDIQVQRLRLLRADHTNQIYRLQDQIATQFPKKIADTQQRIAGLQADLAHYQNAKPPANSDLFSVQLGERVYTDKKEAAQVLLDAVRKRQLPNRQTPIGSYLGFAMSVEYDPMYQVSRLQLRRDMTRQIELGSDPLGNLTRIHNALEGMEQKLEQQKELLETTQIQLKTAQEEVKKPFPKEKEWQEKSQRLAELNALLNLDEKSCDNDMEEADFSEERPAEKTALSHAKKTVVALESSEDMPDPEQNFITYPYADGSQGIRYRLVTMDENGRRIPYPNGRVFVNETMAREFLQDHADEVEEIPYDEMFHRTTGALFSLPGMEYSGKNFSEPER